MKTTQNTPLLELDPIVSPNTWSCIGRYYIANHWTKGKKVCDLGCGLGYGSFMLAGLGTDSVLGLDIAPELEELNKKSTKNLGFQRCDLFDIPTLFRSKGFEVVVATELTEHLPKEKVEEFFDCAKHLASETIILTTPIRRTPKFIWDGGTHLYEYSVEEFTDLMQKNFVQQGWNVQLGGLWEGRGPYGGLFTELGPLDDNARLFFAVIQRNKEV